MGLFNRCRLQRTCALGEVKNWRARYFLTSMKNIRKRPLLIQRLTASVEMKWFKQRLDLFALQGFFLILGEFCFHCVSVLLNLDLFEFKTHPHQANYSHEIINNNFDAFSNWLSHCQNLPPVENFKQGKINTFLFSECKSSQNIWSEEFLGIF